MKKYLTFVLLAALIIALPFFSTHAVLGFDTYFHLARIEGIAEGIASGDFPVRIHAYQLNGYGDPVGLFYPDLFLYLPALLRLAGVPVQIASNIYGILIHIATGLLSLLAFTRLTRSARTGAIAAVLYLGSLYRLTVAYPRTGLGELTAMAFLPLALSALILIVRRGEHRAWPLLVIGATGVLESHILTSLLLILAALGILISSLPRLVERETALSLGKALLATILLNLWFFAPFLWALRHIPIHQTEAFRTLLADTALSLDNLLTLQCLIGWPILALLGAAAALALLRKSRQLRPCLLPLLGATLLLLMTTRAFPWGQVAAIPLLGPLLASLQSPMRLASLLTLLIAIPAARSIEYLADTVAPGRKALIPALLLLCLAGNLLSLHHLPMTFDNGRQALAIDWSIRHDTFAREDLRGANILRHADRTYLDYLPPAITAAQAGNAVPAIPDTAENFHRNGTHLSFDTKNGSQWITLPLFYLPGWEASAHGGSSTTIHLLLETRASADGLLQVRPSPYGSQHIDIHYLGRSWFHTADLISLASLILFCLLAPARLPALLTRQLPAADSPLYPCLLGGITLLVSLPLLSHHIFMGHDILFHLARIEGIAASLAGGQFPVRLQGFQLAGYGYPAGYFYPDLLLYLPALLRLAGLPLGLAYNLLCLSLNIITALLSAIAFTRISGSRCTGCLAASVYLLTLYRLVDLYSRAALGEATALAFLPLALISLHLLLRRPRETRRHTVGLIIGATGVLMSHILTSLLLTGAGILILLINLPHLHTIRHKDRRTILKGLLSAIFATLLLNIWFYAPFVSMYHRISFNMQIMAQGAQDFHLGMAAFTPAAMRTIQGFLGLPLLSVLLLLPIAAIGVLRHRPPLLSLCSNRSLIVLLAIPCLTLLMTTDLFPWEALQQIPPLVHLNVLQFPYRLMALGILPLALIAGSLIERLSSASRAPIPTLILCLGLLLASDTILLQQMKTDHPNKIFATIDFGCYKDRLSDTSGRGVLTDYDWTFLDYAYPDITYETLIGKSLDSFETLEHSRTLLPHTITTDRDDAAINIIEKRGTTLRFTSDTHAPCTAVLPLFSYPDYLIQDETGAVLPHGVTDHHRLTVTLPAGSHTITCHYREPAPYRHAELISLATLLLLLILWKRHRTCEK